MSYTRQIYHVVFRTYRSIECIVESHEKELYNHIYSFCKETNCLLYRIGGMPDHIHILVEMPATMSTATFVQRVKISCNNFMKEHAHLFPDFQGWAKGYCSITYCQQELQTIYNYIKNQKEHHKKRNFENELKMILDASGTKYDEGHLLEE